MQNLSWPLCGACKIHSKILAVILSEQDPKRLSAPGSLRTVFVRRVESGGGESKDLLLLFKETLQTPH